MTEPTFDHERRDVCRLPIASVACSFEITRPLGDPERSLLDVGLLTKILEQAVVTTDPSLLRDLWTRPETP